VPVLEGFDGCFVDKTCRRSGKGAIESGQHRRDLDIAGDDVVERPVTCQRIDVAAAFSLRDSDRRALEQVHQFVRDGVV